MAMVAALVLSACEVADPAANTIVPITWGDGIQPGHADITYLPGGLTGCPGTRTPDDACGGAQNLDIYPVTRGGSLGTLVWVHGGGFTGGDKYPLVAVGPIKRLTHLGWSVVSVNHRLATRPDGRFPAIAQDVIAALRWVRTNGTSYGLDTRRLVVAGYSAGGTLAGLAGTTANAGSPNFPQVPPLSGWVSVAGILDFNAGAMSRFWGTQWLSSASQQAAASPVTWWDAADPQGWLIHGDLDDTVEFANTNSLLARAASSGRVFRDTVDRFTGGGLQSGQARGHAGPMAGMNTNAFVEWLGQLPTLEATANPLGSLDVVRQLATGGLTIGGWTLDPDTPSAIEARVFIDGTERTRMVATTPRDDVGKTFPLHGPNHGFRLTLEDVDPGIRQVCVFGVNAGMGTADTLLGCRTIALAAG